MLARFGVEMIGATAEAIDKAEDRQLFREAMTRIGLATPISMLANATELKRQDRAAHAAELARIEALPEPDEEKQRQLASYHRQWQAGAHERQKRYQEQAVLKAMEGLSRSASPPSFDPPLRSAAPAAASPTTARNFARSSSAACRPRPTTEVLVEESVLGWKEFEMEVVRDKADNCIIVCSIENVDPMGVHTGDSITVAPALTLTDKEYQIMRNASIAVLREIGVETGGSNVQFAVNPDDGRLVVIEMNPRVSRSSALASKATGFPIAKVAAKLAVGYTLDELENDITGGATPASFEPTIDYVVTKIPRFAFEKFPGAERTLTTSMKSVGEVMAIGRTFAESLQKALRGLETGLTGLDDIELWGLGRGDDKNVVRAALGTPTPDRLLKVAQAMRLGFDHEQIYASCRIDPWFLARIQEIVDLEARLKAHGLPAAAGPLRSLKAMGFSDARLGKLVGLSEAQVRQRRAELDVRPVFKRIDTCAAEFASPTAYMYSTYERGLFDVPVDEAIPSGRDKVIILGGGPNRIGQGIEFDYCCCHACFALAKAGVETIMINCNPETVSTDYDTSDRLYFEPLTAEDVLEIIRVEQSRGRLKGVIVQFGGQTPLKLARSLEEAGVPILGTSPDAIDLAEDRDRFKALIDRLQLMQPESGIARTPAEARTVADALGYPVMIRPSYVLGGRAMEIVADSSELDRYIARLSAILDQPSDLAVSAARPLLVDRYLSGAIEIDVDCLCDGASTYVAGIMEHIEEAGIHSGDSACSLPPHSLDSALLVRLEKQTRDLALALKVVGLMNVQYAVKDRQIYVLEVNPRASRTVPFVAKVIGKPVAGIAARIMNGETLASFKLKPVKLTHVGVKEAVFPFARFPGVDPILGPEMRSTGEVMGIDHHYALAFAKSQLGAGNVLPLKGSVFVSLRDQDKEEILGAMRDLSELGFGILATRGTKRALEAHGIACEQVNKVLEGRPHIVDLMKNGEVQLVFNTTEGAKALADSKDIRRTALLNHIPYYTTLAGALAATEAIRALVAGNLSVAPLQTYVSQAS